MTKYFCTVLEAWSRPYYVEADSPEEAAAKLRASIEAGTDMDDYATKEPQYIGQLDNVEDYVTVEQA